MDPPSMSSPSSGSATKHFVWGWGRLTPAPLLLAPARTPAHPNQQRQSMLKNAAGTPAAAQTGHQTMASMPMSPTQAEETYPFPSSAATSAACTLSPTLVEAMETHSVRAIHTAAYHTVAITHGGGLYSWLHHSTSPTDGPLAEDETPSKPPASLTITQVSRQMPMGSRSGPGSRADSPVTVNANTRQQEAIARKGSVSSNALSSASSSTSTATAAAASERSEKKFRRVHVSTGIKTLGLGLAAVPSPTPAISAAALGRNQMLAVTTSGQVLTWDWSNSAAEQSPPSPTNRGPTLLALPPSSSGMGPTLVNGLACGGQFNVLTTSEGTAFSWGKLGTHGRLGQGAPTTIAAATPASPTVGTPQTPEKPSILSNAFQTPPRLAQPQPQSSSPMRSDSPLLERHASVAPKQMILPADAMVSRVAAGWSHGALVLASGGVATFGCGLGGRLGSGNQLDQWIPHPVVGLDQIQIVDVACGYHHTMAVDVTGRVWAFGGNEWGQLGLGDRHPRATPDSLAGAFPDEVVAIACGAFHSAVVTAVGDLYTFGNGKCGQLGFGDTRSSSTPRLVSSLNGMDVCLVACSGDYTIAVTDHFMVMQMDYFGDHLHRADTDALHLPMLVVDQQQQEEQRRRERSDSVASAGSPRSSGHGQSPPHFLASPPAHFASGGGGSSVPQAIPSQRSPSPSPSSAMQSGSNSSLSSSSSMMSHTHGARVPPTPIIFEERDVSSASGPQAGTPMLLSSTGSKVNWPNVAANNGGGPEEEDATPRIRASVSSNALADLSTGGGHSHSQLAKSSSFNRATSAAEAATTPYHHTSNNTPTNANRSAAASAMDSPSLQSCSASFSSNNPSTASSAAAASAAAASAAANSKTIFQLVKDVFAFPPLVHPDLKVYLPTAKPVSSSDPIEASDSSAPSPGPPLPTTPGMTSPVAGLASPSDDSLAALSSLSEFRPANVGKKSTAEVQRQREEVSRMNQAYKVKLRKEGKAKALLREQEATRRKELEKESKELAKKNLEREQRMDEAAEVWLKQIVPNWSTQGRAKKTRELVARVGIPPRVRGVVWPLALGNALMITSELYDIFGQQATRARKQRVAELKAINNAEQGIAGSATPTSGASSSSSASSSLLSSPSFTLGKESTFSYIDVDLTRTYPSLAFFQEECPMNDQLRHLLYTFCFYRPDVGYVQGMSYLAGNFLLYMSPFDAFVSFAHLLNSPFFHVFLKLDTARMAARYRIFDELFMESDPDLCRHFHSEHITPELYFMEWCMTCFAKRLKLDVVGRVWDQYIILGETVVYRTGVAILRAMRKELLGLPFDKIMRKLNATPLDLAEEDVMNALAEVKLSSALKAKLKIINPLLQDD